MALSKFSPSTLRAEINPQGGFATNERYQVVFTNIPAGIDPDSKTNRRLQFLCDSVAIPTKSKRIAKIVLNSELSIFSPIFCPNCTPIIDPRIKTKTLGVHFLSWWWFWWPWWSSGWSWRCI